MTRTSLFIFANKGNCTRRNLPDNVILLGYLKTDKGDGYLIKHLGYLINFLMKLGIAHQIQHFAIAFYYC